MMNWESYQYPNFLILSDLFLTFKQAEIRASMSSKVGEGSYPT